MNGEDILSWGQVAIMPFFFAAIICAGLLKLLIPTLQRHALAHPNERSSHKTPTPQGGGIAVVTAIFVVVLIAAYLLPQFAYSNELVWMLAATFGLAVLGATDDLWPLEALPRLSLQAVAVIVMIAALPIDFRVLPMAPWWIDRAILVVGSLWFVNLVNFMDGLDWITVAEVVPVAGGLAIFGLAGTLPREATLVALALCGAMIGFAPFNRPIARIFLGDVGSLPIGLLLCWLLIVLAGAGYLTAAILLPLYYIADATITLVNRLLAGKPVTEAHRDHFYQRAADGQFNVYKIVGYVFLGNLILCALAGVTLLGSSRALHAIALAAGIAVVGALLWRFNTAGRQKLAGAPDSNLNTE